MKDNFKLIGITVLFVLTGLVLSFFALQESDLVIGHSCEVDGIEYVVGEEIIGYQKGHTCTCGKEGIVECIPGDVEDLQEEVSLEITGLEIEGLKFEYNYLTGITNGDASLAINPLSFKNVNILEGSLIIVLEQMQLCPEANVVSEQVGFYEYNDNVLKLYNMIKTTSGDENVSCMVQLKYTFEEFKDLNDLEIAFVDETGLYTYAPICLYDEKIYSEGDVFRNSEGLICTCQEGDLECEKLSD